MTAIARPGLERRLRAERTGEVLFDAFSRGRYATDASHYQMMPVGVVVPRTIDEAKRAMAIAAHEGVSILARGAGTSQSGQTVNDALVIDCSKYVNKLISLNIEQRTCVVEPGIVLDDLNRQLREHGLWFPVDISTASRATLGGMAGNNSCGGRSLRYGTMRHNVRSMDATLVDGRSAMFGPVTPGLAELGPGYPLAPLFSDLLALGRREADEVRERFPQVQRRVGGYNLDALVPDQQPLNMAHVLVGSEGTLAFTTGIELKLWPMLGPRGVGACHFGSFHAAMDAAQHIVKLNPIAVELIDSTMIALARDIAMFRPTIEQFVKGEPEALLLVEFAEDPDENRRRLVRLSEVMGDLDGWNQTGSKWGGVVEVLDPALQSAITNVRTAGLNIMMSMKEARKPVSFVEDCAVPLEHLADYTARLTDLFARHGTRGTWYAHASEGCLHVRPVLNLRLEKDVKAMRAIAEEAFALVRNYKGSHSGEHGDGLVRSEFHEVMFGRRIGGAFEELKAMFDPKGLMNPGRIVHAPKFDDRELFRLSPGYHIEDFTPALDWTDYPGPAGGFSGAVEMCNNNGACRALAGGAMCPSYRATRNERDVTRGRANSLRLALSGQLGPDALTSTDMAETLKLCVSCKACRRECPTGVDMARMKIEVLAARAAKFGPSVRDRLIAYLPHYAPYAARVPWLFNLRDRIPGLAALMEAATGLCRSRALPTWRRDAFDRVSDVVGPPDGREVVLLADTFNRYFEPENLEAAIYVLTTFGYRVHLPGAASHSRRPLCCGRTFLSAGLIDHAQREIERTTAALLPFVERGVPVIGLEPSCLLTLRDEALAIGAHSGSDGLARNALLFEEFILREQEFGRLQAKLGPISGTALLHTHCHQKAFGLAGIVERAVQLIPDLEVTPIDSGCCGMAGAFGYQAETQDVSRAMAELGVLAAVRSAPQGTRILADGTSCRSQISELSGRSAQHVARIFAESLRVGQQETKGG